MDGNFEDWNSKPLVNDAKHDIKSPDMDFQQVRYIAYKEYLYLYVSRLAADKSEPWQFSVVILNDANGKNQIHSPFGTETSVNTADFNIATCYINNKGSSGTVISVSFNGRELENTFSASDNAKEIEFRIPLSEVGLEGSNKEVKFALKSEFDADSESDWLPDGQFVLITTDPTGWILSSMGLFLTVSTATYNHYKNKI